MPCGSSPTATTKTRERTPDIVWLAVESIDEPDPERNSRSRYADASIVELAASLRQNGVLQPLCVRPSGSRYELVFGVRRLRAAREAGLRRVPCLVLAADDKRAFMLNAVENLHREQLSNSERLQTIQRMAASGLGVREISRRTGFNASTISRWLRVHRRPELKAALEAGRIDVAHAVVLVEAPTAALPGLIERACCTSTADLRASVKLARSAGPACGPEAPDERNLRQALRCLKAVNATDHVDLIEAIRCELRRLSP